jgi:hypothetical protein
MQVAGLQLQDHVQQVDHRAGQCMEAGDSQGAAGLVQRGQGAVEAGAHDTGR